MRINSLSQVSQLYKTQSGRTRKQGTSYESQMDAYSVSSTGKDYQTASAALSRVPDVRQDKVASVKAALSSGTYSVSPDAFASHLLDAYAGRTI